MPRKQRTKTAEPEKPKGPDLASLGRAGEHFIAGATEMVVGTGFAIKGMKELLEHEEGRKFICELPFKVVSTGFDMAKKAGQKIKDRRKERAGSRGGKRSRKINVE